MTHNGHLRGVTSAYNSGAWFGGKNPIGTGGHKTVKTIGGHFVV